VDINTAGHLNPARPGPAGPRPPCPAHDVVALLSALATGARSETRAVAYSVAGNQASAVATHAVAPWGPAGTTAMGASVGALVMEMGGANSTARSTPASTACRRSSGFPTPSPDSPASRPPPSTAPSALSNPSTPSLDQALHENGSTPTVPTLSRR
jgi:hypothetical protein